MIEINDKAIIQYVYFPKSTNVVYDTYEITLHSELSQKSYSFTGLTDNSNSKNYYKFNVDFSQVDDGEYNYDISGLSSGLIRIGEITDNLPNRTDYVPFADDNEIIQYYGYGNYKYRFQNNKVIEVTENGTYNVKPDSGYTALLNVEVHANIPSLYESGFTAGYASGYTDGSSILKNSHVVFAFVDDEGLYDKAQVTVSFNGSAFTQTYEGSDIEFSVLPGVSFNYSFSKVKGYNTPQSGTSFSTWDGTTVIDVEYVDLTGIPVTMEIGSDGEIAVGGEIVVQYSKNGGEWETLDGDNPIEVVAGDVVSFQSNTQYYDLDENHFMITATVNRLYGNLSSMVTTTSSPLAFGSMFCYVTTLIDASDLILSEINLDAECFFSFFNGCTSLVNAPELPATTLASNCYQNMFRDCTSLVNAPELPARTLAESCYDSMFSGCRSLINAPSLPSTSLDYACYYNMFQGCTSLVNAPALPARTLANSCYYNMFGGCTSLTTAPELPATVLKTSCYSYMFLGCTNLNYVNCNATDISATNCTNNWVTGVSATGTFVKNANMEDWTIGNNGIPSGWNVQ